MDDVSQTARGPWSIEMQTIVGPREVVVDTRLLMSCSRQGDTPGHGTTSDDTG